LVSANQSPPWLKSQLVGAASSEMHSTIFQNGAYRESLISGWLKAINEPQVIPDVLNNEKNSEYWSSTTLKNKYFHIKWPAVHLTGWYKI